ncbi:tRNA 2-selenouridine(34) synthase MnmH [Curvibacter sp. APW13]|uniref:tRNA 2-selenouridine(34) synthase MnmH n=1 Tax=Curvibacter sp. APW13 TaxID=3077236 RepID=UPI0028DE1C9B|nr:tRNA 2-selenouridine(34) synthase MnmH [Curvibacter sp. APW13]MDT8991708.1 tRNA 2-selenouridine(34) synthase MnmH [Curvibacter sp. APW13]
MSLQTIPAVEALAQLDRFDTIIDARSEAEYAEDHLPGAVNWPTLDNQERIEIGTMYKQVNAFEAKKRGAAIAARNIARHIETHVLDKPKNWAPLTYCWRGGKRSGSLSLVLGQIGFHVTLIEGGYKAFRAAMLADLQARVPLLAWRVVCGTTGSGKTRLLHALAQEGAQVLDLEALACHRSSVLGAVPGVPQPTQKHFDMRVWDAIRRFDPTRPVYVESESKKVGNVAISDALIAAMRASPCISLRLADDQRVRLLMEDYDFFVQNTDRFCERLEALTQARGRATIERWQEQVHTGHIADVVLELLTAHYDPVYTQSMQRNFVRYPHARTVNASGIDATAMRSVARELLAQEP